MPKAKKVKFLWLNYIFIAMHILTLQVSNFNCLLYIYLHCLCIFSLQPHIYIAKVYFHCLLIFLLQTYIYIASADFYCKRIFVLLAHIFIVSAHFHCNLDEKISHAVQKISHAALKISHGLVGNPT